MYAVNKYEHLSRATTVKKLWHMWQKWAANAQWAADNGKNWKIEKQTVAALIECDCSECPSFRFAFDKGDS